MDLFLLVILFDAHNKPNSVPQKAFIEHRGCMAADGKEGQDIAQRWSIHGVAMRQ